MTLTRFNKWEKWMVLLMFLFVNNLFWIKYAYPYIHQYTGYLVVLYSLFVIVFVVFYTQIVVLLVKIPVFLFVVTALVIVLMLNTLLVPEEIQVDRWSAMQIGIQSVWKGQYPYSAVDHLGGRTSNLPGLMLIGFPFYGLGDVGLLQIAVFILLVWFLFLNFRRNTVFLVVILLLLSPAYWWEVLVKSDLMSNLILAFMFTWMMSKQKPFLQKSPYLTGIVLSVLLLTRVVVVIPILLAFKLFITQSSVVYFKKLMFGFSLISVVLLVLVLKDCPSFHHLLHYNPLNLQGGVTPLGFNVFVIGLTIMLSYTIKTEKQFLFSSIFLMSLPVLYGFIDSVIRFGFLTTLFADAFDLSYWGMLLVFILFAIDKYWAEKKDFSVHSPKTL